MANLSQNQPTPLQTPDAPVSDQPPVEEPKPAQTSDIPTSDQPPVAQPDKSSFPPMQDGEKPISPKQEEIKKELSELGIPPEGRTKKTRVLLAALGVFLLIVSLPAAVYLVKQRQEIRKEAYPGQVCTVDSDCTGQCEVCKSGKCEVKTCSGDQCLGWGTCECKAECHQSGDGYICCNGNWVPQSQGCSDCGQPTGFCAGSGKNDGRDPGLPGPSDCNGIWCHTGQYNYCCWDQNGNGQWDPGVDACSRGQSSDVSCEGNCIVFRGHQGESVTFLKYYTNHDVSCPYGPGVPASETITIPSDPFSKCVPSDRCGQLEADGYCGVCKPSGCGGGPVESPSPSPSLPPDTAQCDYCKIFDTDWEEITDLSTLIIGQTIYLTTRGSTTHPQGIDKARFRINSGDWQETTAQHGVEFYIQYTIPSAGSYTIESMVHNPTLGWY